MALSSSPGASGKSPPPKRTRGEPPPPVPPPPPPPAVVPSPNAFARRADRAAADADASRITTEKTKLNASVDTQALYYRDKALPQPLSGIAALERPLPVATSTSRGRQQQEQQVEQFASASASSNYSHLNPPSSKYSPSGGDGPSPSLTPATEPFLSSEDVGKSRFFHQMSETRKRLGTGYDFDGIDASPSSPSPGRPFQDLQPVTSPKQSALVFYNAQHADSDKDTQHGGERTKDLYNHLVGPSRPPWPPSSHSPTTPADPPTSFPSGKHTVGLPTKSPKKTILNRIGFGGKGPLDRLLDMNSSASPSSSKNVPTTTHGIPEKAAHILGAKSMSSRDRRPVPIDLTGPPSANSSAKQYESPTALSRSISAPSPKKPLAREGHAGGDGRGQGSNDSPYLAGGEEAAQSSPHKPHSRSSLGAKLKRITEEVPPPTPAKFAGQAISPHGRASTKASTGDAGSTLPDTTYVRHRSSPAKQSQTPHLGYIHNSDHLEDGLEMPGVSPQNLRHDHMEDDKGQFDADGPGSFRPDPLRISRGRVDMTKSSHFRQRELETGRNISQSTSASIPIFFDADPSGRRNAVQEYAGRNDHLGPSGQAMEASSNIEPRERAAEDWLDQLSSGSLQGQFLRQFVLENRSQHADVVQLQSQALAAVQRTRKEVLRKLCRIVAILESRLGVYAECAADGRFSLVTMDHALATPTIARGSYHGTYDGNLNRDLLAIGTAINRIELELHDRLDGLGEAVTLGISDIRMDLRAPDQAFGSDAAIESPRHDDVRAMMDRLSTRLDGMGDVLAALSAALDAVTDTRRGPQQSHSASPIVHGGDDSAHASSSSGRRIWQDGPSGSDLAVASSADAHGEDGSRPSTGGSHAVAAAVEARWDGGGARATSSAHAAAAALALRATRSANAPLRPDVTETDVHPALRGSGHNGGGGCAAAHHLSSPRHHAGARL